jgi:alanyl-tRNA synthetase
MFLKNVLKNRGKSKGFIGHRSKKRTCGGATPQTETIFTGYETTEDTAKGIAVYKDNKKDILYLVLDRTPFYPEKGGKLETGMDCSKQSCFYSEV